MVDLTTSFIAGTAATIIPLFIGLFAPRLLWHLSGRSTRSLSFLAAISAGIIFWFFFDAIGDAAQLDVNQGFQGDYTHPLLAALFAAGLLALFALDRRQSPKNQSGGDPNSIVTIAFPAAAVAALGIGFHALGEGLTIGSKLPSAPDILEAIGGLSPGVAYVLHKLLEGFVIGVLALIASSATSRKLGVLGALAGIPTMIGFFLGLPGVLDSTYFFALGAAGAVFIELKLIPQIIRRGPEYWSVISLLLGFYAMYFAGLFHS